MAEGPDAARASAWDSHFCGKAVALDVRNASYTVKVAGGKRKILDDISLTAQGGELLALMGPSGAGKTTFLEYMALELKGGESEGCVLLNNECLTFEMFRQQAVYVEQYDHHWAFLTCREILQFAAKLYLQGSRAQQEARVEAIMEQLGLMECADTRAGNHLFKGMSGGQRKRLTAGIAMLKAPAVMFLDEPTSGLDAASCSKCMAVLKDLARNTNMIIIATIHQPSTQVFMAFDKVMFLANGRAAFNGSPAKVGDYCEGLGHPLPEFTNPADHFLELVNSEFVGRPQVDEIVKAWRSRSAPQALNEDIKPLPRPGKQAVGRQCRTILHRHLLLSLRDPSLYVGRMAVFLLANLFFVLIYFKARERSQEYVLPRLYLTAWFFSVPSILSVVVVFATGEEFKLVKKEIKNGLVRTGPYIFANLILQLPYMLIMSFCALAGPYLLANYNAENLIPSVMVLALMLWCFESMGQFIGVCFRNTLVGMLVQVATWFCCFLFMGMFLKQTFIFGPFGLLCDILPLKWTIQSMAYLGFMGSTFEGARPSAESPLGYVCTGDGFITPCWGFTGEQVLRSLSGLYTSVTEENTVVQNAFIVGLMAVIFKVLFVITFLMQSISLSTVVSACTRRRCESDTSNSACHSDSAAASLNDVELDC